MTVTKYFMPLQYLITNANLYLSYPQTVSYRK